MADAEVRYGSDPRLIDLARTISAEQTAEVQLFSDLLSATA